MTGCRVQGSHSSFRPPDSAGESIRLRFCPCVLVTGWSRRLWSEGFRTQENLSIKPTKRKASRAKSVDHHRFWQGAVTPSGPRLRCNTTTSRPVRDEFFKGSPGPAPRWCVFCLPASRCGEGWDLTGSRTPVRFTPVGAYQRFRIRPLFWQKAAARSRPFVVCQPYPALPAIVRSGSDRSTATELTRCCTAPEICRQLPLTSKRVSPHEQWWQRRRGR